MKKETLVFIGGLGTNKDIWLPQMELEEHYNIIRLELLGHGSNQSTMEITLSNMALDILNQLHQLGIRQKVHFIGSSLGGVVIQDIWKKDKDKVKSLTLCNTIASMSPALSFANSFRSLYNIRIMDEQQHYDSIERFCLYNKSEEVKEMVRKGFTLRDEYNECGKLINFLNNKHILRSITVPSLVITSRKDMVVPEYYSLDIYANLINSWQRQLIHIDDSGHLPNVESKRFNTILHNFIASQNKL